MDITVRDVLTQKAKTFFKVDSETAQLFIAAGLAVPYVKPQEVTATGPRFFVEQSTYTGVPMLAVTLASGEKRAYTTNATSDSDDEGPNRISAEKLLGAGPIPAKVWASFLQKCKSGARQLR